MCPQVDKPVPVHVVASVAEDKTQASAAEEFEVAQASAKTKPSQEEASQAKQAAPRGARPSQDADRRSRSLIAATCGISCTRYPRGYRTQADSLCHLYLT